MPLTDLFPPAGNLSLVVDTILPIVTLQKAKRDKNFKQWLIQVALEKVEERYGVELSRSEPESRRGACAILH